MVMHCAGDIEQAAEHPSPTGVVNGPPVASTGLPRDKPEVVWMATARAVAEWMALHLGYEPAIRVNIDAQRLADRREHAARKTHINDGATYRDYAAECSGPLRTFMTVRSHLASYNSSWSSSRALTQVNAVVAAAVLGCGPGPPRQVCGMQLGEYASREALGVSACRRGRADNAGRGNLHGG